MVLLSALLLSASADVAGESAGLDAAARHYDAAQANGDRLALQDLLAPDYLLVNSSGAVEDKTQFIVDLTDPGYKLLPYVVRHPIDWRWPGRAVLGGVALLKGVSAGKPFEVCLRFADVWRLTGSRWQVVYSQAARAQSADCAGDVQ
ncbi:MAG: nuclear transport factor 2 family protein [Sphingomonas sp.]